MLTLGIRYLTGRAVATDTTERDRAEWPPHPARVFMAMVAAHGESGEAAQEADALRWLEAQGSPSAIYAKPAAAPDTAFVTRFVPVNDRAGPAKGTLQSAPSFTRSRAARTFPSVHLEDERVFLTWEVSCPPEHRAALEAVCGKVTRIGHSSSLVQMWIADEAPETTWRRTDAGATRKLRTIGPGLLDRLRSEYAADPGRLPQVTIWQGYAPADPSALPPPHTLWDPDFLVMQLRPLESSVRQLDLASTLRLTGALHRALIGRWKTDVPEYVSGHRPDGSATEDPHMALLPLPFVGRPHADGLIRGVGIALPRGLSRSERNQVAAAVHGVGDPGPRREGGLTLGRLGRWELAPHDAVVPPVTLRASTWSGPAAGARVWASVTPVVFDRHPKGEGEEYLLSVQAMVREACSRIGLRNLLDVRTSHVSAHTGVPTAGEFPRMERKDGTLRRHLHVMLRFADPVRGPVAIGAGRFRGYGLLRPLPRGEAT